MSLVERMNVDGGDRNEEGRERPELNESISRQHLADEENVEGGGRE